MPMETRRIRSPEDGVTRGCDPPDLGAEDRSQVFIGSSKCY